MIKKLLSLLNYKEKRRAQVLIFMILVMALLDMVGVASILPFIALLAYPEVVETNTLLNTLFSISRRFGIDSSEDFLLALGIGTFTLFITSLGFKALTTYAQTRFALMCEYSISKRLVEGYLHQPYTWFLDRHSADLGKTALSEVSAVIHTGLMPLMTLIAQSSVVLGLLMMLILVDPLLALNVFLVLGSAYTCIFAFVAGWLKDLGKERLQANRGRFTTLSEAFGAIKEVKIGGLENTYVTRFSGAAEIYAKGQATARVIAQLPRFFLEAVVFGGMLFVIFYLMAQSGSLTASLPTIALYAFAGYRLMPALQHIYLAFTELRFSSAALDALHCDITSLDKSDVNHGQVMPLPFEKAIELKNVYYSYPNVTKKALKGIDVSISAGSKVGFVGATGSGKTTAVDVILGLLEPQKGRLVVDDINICAANVRQWQCKIGYVPQDIYLSDTTVASNIAFGVNAEEIDYQAVEHAAKMANLHDFVMNELHEGYATFVGERGVRLSGGQRQRIGIARALYHKPSVLILDEATSALDNLTEKVVMEAVSNIGRDITVVLIAHRLSTVQDCDMVYLLERGEVAARGSFYELIDENDDFSKMASHPTRG